MCPWSWVHSTITLELGVHCTPWGARSMATHPQRWVSRWGDLGAQPRVPGAGCPDEVQGHIPRSRMPVVGAALQGSTSGSAGNYQPLTGTISP